MLAHHLDGALHDPVHAGGAHHHVVRLLLEHELAGPAQRVEGAFLQRAELVLAVPVGEVGEHEERQPVRGLLVEGAQDARRVEAARVAVQQFLRLLPALAAEVGVQQVDHRPQVPPFLDVHLEQVAQVVQARRGGAQVALLLHRGGLGVALDHDQPLQLGPVLPRHLGPYRLALVLAEPGRAARVPFGQEDPPPVLRHGHVTELRPAVPADVDRSAQVDVLGRQRRAHGLPPLDKVRLPGLQRALQPPVLVQVDVVQDLLGVVRGRGQGNQTRFRSKTARCPVPNRRSAPSGPDALGRLNIQFCQAVSRPKILVSMVSGPANR